MPLHDLRPGTMPLPIVSYLLPGSPPRSPHVAPPGYFESYFKPSSSSNRPPSFRPTRRDILLCLLTISFSYLLFSSPQSSSSAVFPFASSTSTSRTNRNSASSSDSGYFGKWNFFSQSDSCPAVSEDRAERTFGESVQTHGFTNSPSHFNTESVDVIVTGGSKDDVTGIEQTDLEISAEGTWWEEGEDEDEDDELENGATVLRGFQPGWTLVDRLYLYNGSFYVVTWVPVPSYLHAIDLELTRAIQCATVRLARTEIDDFYGSASVERTGKSGSSRT